MPMEDRLNVTVAHDTDEQPDIESPVPLTAAKRAALGLLLALGATLTYLEMFNRFSP